MPPQWSLQMSLQKFHLLRIHFNKAYHHFNLKIEKEVQRNPGPSNCCISAHHPTASLQLRWTPSRAYPGSSSWDAIKHLKKIKKKKGYVSAQQYIQHPTGRSQLPSVDQHFHKQFHPPQLACTYNQLFQRTQKNKNNENKIQRSKFSTEN